MSLRQSHGRPLQARASHGRAALNNPRNENELNQSAVHDHYIDQGKGGMNMAVQTVTAKLKKHVVVPVEEEVEVPVFKKEVRKKMVRQTIRCQRLVPVTRYKEVEETTLETRVEIINGRKEKRAIPITQMRMQPYQDFEEEFYDKVVEVPMEEVVTRTGTRIDKQVVSRIVEVEQEHVYEMRPVLVSKGEAQHRHIGDHHKFKHEHGKPAWSDDVKAGWLGKPQTPGYRTDLHRPRSACSVLGKRFDRERNLLHSSATALGLSRSGGSRPASRTGRPLSRSGSEVTNF